MRRSFAVAVLVVLGSAPAHGGADATATYAVTTAAAVCETRSERTENLRGDLTLAGEGAICGFDLVRGDASVAIAIGDASGRAVAARWEQIDLPVDPPIVNILPDPPPVVASGSFCGSAAIAIVPRADVVEVTLLAEGRSPSCPGATAGQVSASFS